MNEKKYIVRWFLCVGIIGTAFFLFMFMNLAGNRTTPPFFSSVSEIAANEEYVYALDDRNTMLMAYRNNGDLVWCEDFSSTGGNRIFCDDNGNVCRLDAHKRKVYVYDKYGNELDCYQATSAELINNGVIDRNPVENVKVTDCEYIFDDNIFANSKILVYRNQEFTAEIIVESWISHVLWYMIIIALIAVFVYGGYNLAYSIVQNLGMISTSNTGYPKRHN